MKLRINRSLFISVTLGLMLTVAGGQTSQSGTKTDKPVLSEAQISSIKAIRSASEKRAAMYALQLAAATRRIYKNMMAEHEDHALRKKLSKEMDAAVLAVLAIKGQSIREMIHVLSPEQKDFIRREMRKPGASADLSELIMKTFAVPEK